MSLWEDVLSACVVIGLCSGTSETLELPEDDGSLFEYRMPEPVEPVPVVEPKPPELPPLIVEKIVHVHHPAVEPAVVETPPEPSVDPKVLAYYTLLNSRRLGALSNGLNNEYLPVRIAEVAAKTTDDLSLPETPVFTPGLDFTLNSSVISYPKRYKHPGMDSGLPVDNTRIMRSDRYINAVFEGGINSQLATGGEVILQVSSHVYGYHGRNIIIPKGSRIICSYEVPALANSTRLDFECARILLAHSAVEIYQLKSKAYDVHANLGVSGLVDNRFWDRYGEAILFTGISLATRIAAGTIKTSSKNPNLTTSVDAGAEELSQRFGEITSSVLENQINTKPIIRIAQGTPVVVKPANDWYIAKPSKEITQ